MSGFCSLLWVVLICLHNNDVFFFGWFLNRCLTGESLMVLEFFFFLVVSCRFETLVVFVNSA